MGNKNSSRKVAESIVASVAAAGHDLTWLANETRIPYSTLRRRVIDRPDLLTISTVLAVSAALDLPVSTLIGGHQ